MFADRTEPLSIQDAYRIQYEVARLRTLRGERIAGYKIGCISETIQRQLGVDGPVFGHLFHGEIRPSNAVLSSKDFDHLGIEGEFALTLAVDVPDLAALRRAPRSFIRDVFPVIELHNYVFRGPSPRAPELIANNAVHAGFVAAPATLLPTTVEQLGISVWINDELMGEAREDPAAALCELAQRLDAFGVRLRAGDVVLTGSPLPLYSVEAGARIRVESPEAGEATAQVAG